MKKTAAQLLSGLDRSAADDRLVVFDGRLAAVGRSVYVEVPDDGSRVEGEDVLEAMPGTPVARWINQYVDGRAAASLAMSLRDVRDFFRERASSENVVAILDRNLTVSPAVVHSVLSVLAPRVAARREVLVEMVDFGVFSEVSTAQFGARVKSTGHFTALFSPAVESDPEHRPEVLVPAELKDLLAKDFESF